VNNESSPDTGKKPLSSHGRLLDSEQFPMLQDMPSVMIGVLNAGSNLMHVSDGVELLQEGNTTHDLYFIASGTVAITKHSENGDVELRRLGAGDVFGEFGTLRGKARFASVRTIELSHIIRVKFSELQKVLEFDPAFRARLTQLMNSRILLSFIATHPAFKGLSEAAVIDLADRLSLRFVAQDEPIFMQGERIDAPCMMVSGEATVRVDGEMEMLLALRRDKEFIGAARDKDGNAVYSAVASEDADLLILDDAAMSMLRSHSPAVADHLEELITEQSARTFDQIAKFTA